MKEKIAGSGPPRGSRGKDRGGRQAKPLEPARQKQQSGKGARMVERKAGVQLSRQAPTMQHGQGRKAPISMVRPKTKITAAPRSILTRKLNTVRAHMHAPGFLGTASSLMHARSNTSRMHPQGGMVPIGMPRLPIMPPLPMLMPGVMPGMMPLPMMGQASSFPMMPPPLIPPPHSAREPLVARQRGPGPGPLGRGPGPMSSGMASSSAPAPEPQYTNDDLPVLPRLPQKRRTQVREEPLDMGPPPKMTPKYAPGTRL